MKSHTRHTAHRAPCGARKNNNFCLSSIFQLLCELCISAESDSRARDFHRRWRHPYKYVPISRAYNESHVSSNPQKSRIKVKRKHINSSHLQFEFQHQCFQQSWLTILEDANLLQRFHVYTYRNFGLEFIWQRWQNTFLVQCTAPGPRVRKPSNYLSNKFKFSVFFLSFFFHGEKFSIQHLVGKYGGRPRILNPINSHYKNSQLIFVKFYSLVYAKIEPKVCARMTVTSHIIMIKNCCFTVWAWHWRGTLRLAIAAPVKKM